jgi:radical SAM superfamily enzyme YgiQ (UPF0313 family)
LIIGFPEETKKDIKTTIRYAHKLKQLGSDLFWICCATPYPGTRLFEECIEKGIINKKNLDLRQLSTSDSAIHNKYFSAKELKKIRIKAMRGLNPKPGSSLSRKFIKAIIYLFTNPKYLIWRVIICRMKSHI